MIALDTSALVAIAFQEDDFESYRDLIATRSNIIGVATLIELHAVLRGRLVVDPIKFIDELIAFPTLSVVSISIEHFEASRKALDRYGKGRGHPAQLNFGDCLAYAVAKVANVPLLFKGDDFLHTDIQPAHRA